MIWLMLLKLQRESHCVVLHSNYFSPGVQGWLFWDQSRRIELILLISEVAFDANGDGMAEIVGYGMSGLLVALSTDGLVHIKS